MIIKTITKYLNVKMLLNAGTPLVCLVIGMILDLPLYLPLAIILAIIIHELGHFLLMKHYRYENVSVYFILPLGGIVLGTKSKPKVSEYLFILIAGPAQGMIIGGLIVFFGKILTWDDLFNFGIIIYAINAVNMLPIFPMDGGRFITCLSGVKNKHLLLPILIPTLLILFLIFYYGLYYLSGLALVQILFVVFAIRGDELTDKFKYDLNVKQVIAFSIFYLLTGGLFSGLLLYNFII